ncbi:MAG: hypothetical protein HYY49_13845 [Ignavibacteriales bacterium]|nr:hypothetical protein [Ignavibacteriales bacterium]
MTPRRALLLTFILSFCIAFPMFAKPSVSLHDSVGFRPEVERLFVEAMRVFTAGRFDSAASLFAKHIKDFPRSHRSTGSYIMGAKAYYRLENFRESIRFLKDLIDLYRGCSSS